MGYVYTLDAVRSRLRRGAKSVKFFMPYTGRIVTVTQRNIKAVSKRMREVIARH